MTRKRFPRFLAAPASGVPSWDLVFVDCERSRRGEANAEHHLRNHRWAREQQAAERDRAWFEREVAPKLDAFSLKEIAEATGLSPAACSRIRAGKHVPHPWHWDALHELIEGKIEGGRSPTPFVAAQLQSI